MATEFVADSIKTADTEQFSQALQPFNVRLDQLSAGQFKSQTDLVRTDGLIIYRERWNRRMHVSGSSPEGLNLIGTVANRGRSYLWLGDDLHSDNIAFAHPGEEMNFFTHQNAEHCVLLAAEDVLVRHLGEESAAALKRSPIIDCGSDVAHRLATTIQRIIGNSPHESGCREYSEAIEFEAIEPLMELTLDTRRPAGARGKPKRQRALRRAIEYADELQRPIPVPQLAQVIGVSRRTLEYAFAETFGISPVKYLRIARLNRLHHMLGLAEPGTTTVTACAANFGFSEFGRLAGEYRSLFGELPSASLQRRPQKTLKTLADKVKSGVR